MKALGEDVRVLRQVSETTDAAPVTVTEVRHRAEEVARRLELCRKINRSEAFADNLDRSILAARAVGDVAEDPVPRQQAVLRLERTCTRCHTRLW